LSLGDRLREARLDKSLKQVDVKIKTGINNKTLSNYENNVSSPDPDTLKVLAELYDVTTDQIIYGKNKNALLNVPVDVVDKKPKDLIKFLEQSEVMFDGEIYKLDEEGRAKVRAALEFAFWDAKRQNKRKKD